ncbi:hypothetical protein SLA2020_271440 [Shorea laevis]
MVRPYVSLQRVVPHLGCCCSGWHKYFCKEYSAPTEIFDCMSKHKVTHLGGAPTVLNMIVNATPSERRPLPGKVSIMTGGASPPPHVLFKMEELGFSVTHCYGMTETYGAGAVCTWKPEWNSLPQDAQAKLKARQGLKHLAIEELDIKDPVTMKTVPSDAKTMGEVMFRGNTVMSGYFKNLEATHDAFNGGWFRSGDFGVKHPDGYIQVKDRCKDNIISGGEHVSTIEVESVLFSHPAVLEAAVVGRPDNQLGETPCAFVKLKDGCDASAEEIIEFCRNCLPHYMAPQTVVFEDLPKTSTGKTQKFVLRKRPRPCEPLRRRPLVDFSIVSLYVCVSCVWWLGEYECDHELDICLVHCYSNFRLSNFKLIDICKKPKR